jgi:hypothetical protein
VIWVIWGDLCDLRLAHLAALGIDPALLLHEAGLAHEVVAHGGVSNAVEADLFMRQEWITQEAVAETADGWVQNLSETGG